MLFHKQYRENATYIFPVKERQTSHNLLLIQNITMMMRLHYAMLVLFAWVQLLQHALLLHYRNFICYTYLLQSTKQEMKLGPYKA
jgi:hypothetical protein